MFIYELEVIHLKLMMVANQYLLINKSDNFQFSTTTTSKKLPRSEQLVSGQNFVIKSDKSQNNRQEIELQETVFPADA